MKRPIELNACLANKKTLDDVEIDYFDAFYLGQPYCLKFQGNYIVNTDDLELAVDILHDKGKKAYLVTPAIPTSRELSLVRKALKSADKVGIDGVEASDVGVFRLIRNEFPELRVHVGNFANVYNDRSATLFKELGATRIVPAQELTKDELSDVVSVEGVEFERPIHGPLSLGMAFSCLFLKNEENGKCRQECDGDYFMELDGWRMRSVGTSVLMGEDYCLVEHLQDLLKLNLTAWRLETYFDSAEKISLLGKIYNQALNDGVEARGVGIETIQAAGELSLKGLCNGWHFGRSGRVYVARDELDVKQRG